MEKITNFLLELAQRKEFTSLLQEEFRTVFGEFFDKTTIGVELEFQACTHFRDKGKTFNFLTNESKDTPLGNNSFACIISAKEALEKVKKLAPDFKLLSSTHNDGGGIEFVFKPATITEYLANAKNFATLFKYVREQGYSGEDGASAGMHVHFDRSCFGNGEILANIVKTISEEPCHKSFKSICKRDAKVADFYCFSQNVKENLDWLKKLSQENFLSKDFGYTLFGSSIKLNTNGVGTIEFRCFKTTTNLRVFFHRLVFLGCLGAIATDVKNGKINLNTAESLISLTIHCFSGTYSFINSRLFNSMFSTLFDEVPQVVTSLETVKA